MTAAQPARVKTSTAAKTGRPTSAAAAKRSAARPDKSTAAKPTKKTAKKPAKSTTAKPAKKTPAKPAKSTTAKPAKQTTAKPAKQPAAAATRTATARAAKPAVDAGAQTEASRAPSKAQRKTPHRPSRRQLIVDAAITVFARKGFSETSIQEIADEANMVPTAVYYHFSGKEELFESALRRAMEASDAVITETRPDSAPGNAEVFTQVTFASWDWIEDHPDEARLLFLHMPGGATPGAKMLREDFEDRHVRRAYDYFSSKRIPASRRSAAAQHAARTLAVRTMIGLTASIHPLRMEGGPLASMPRTRLRQAVADVSTRIITGG